MSMKWRRQQEPLDILWKNFYVKKKMEKKMVAMHTIIITLIQ